MDAETVRPDLRSSAGIATLERGLPHGDRSFEIPLLRFCPEALEVFLTIDDCRSHLRVCPAGCYPPQRR